MMRSELGRGSKLKNKETGEYSGREQGQRECKEKGRQPHKHRENLWGESLTKGGRDYDNEGEGREYFKIGNAEHEQRIARKKIG